MNPTKRAWPAATEMPREGRPMCNHCIRILTVPCHLSQAEFDVLVENALADVPSPFARYLEEIPVEVRPRPTARQLRSVGVDSRHLLLGLYEGRARTQRSVEDSGVLPDVIYIFQEPIELVCATRTQLAQQVRKTVLHEIGHHFGMNEEDLEELGYG